MRKFFLCVLALALIVVPGSMTAASVQGEFLPLSPEYLEWVKRQEERKNSPVQDMKSGEEQYPTGHIPSPIDYSHLADNPPRIPESIVQDNKASVLPSKYDLRNVDGKSYVTSVKTQKYGTCWAFASIGAIESSYLKNIGGYAVGGDDPIDLSEMHLAWYTFRNADTSKVFMYEKNKDKTFTEILDNGGYADYAVALYSRLDGPVLESDLPFVDDKQPSEPTPESYKRVLKLKASYPISYPYLPKEDYKSLNTAKNIIKRLVMENGSLYAGYLNDIDSYKLHIPKIGASYYFEGTEARNGHAVQIIGWDDNFSRENFKTDPGMDGAWLMKNSWSSIFGDKGYFWMSYAQSLRSITAFSAEETNETMKAYLYDNLGQNLTWGLWNKKAIYAANVFKAERDEELAEVGFFTGNNNQQYEIQIYTDMGESMPSNPKAGKLAVFEPSKNLPYAGYHTVKLSEIVKLKKGDYFSIILRLADTGYVPVESSNYDSNVVIENGSFFSFDGEDWTTGEAIHSNACVRGFTIAREDYTTPPEILTDTLPEGTAGTEYSVTLSASGTNPFTWSIINGSLPSGLTLNKSSGKISGTPGIGGIFYFTVKLENTAGSTEKTFALNIEVPYKIITESLPGGTTGTDYNAIITSDSSESLSWSISKGTLPPGLDINPQTGTITGTPSSEGSYTFTVRASGSLGIAEHEYTVKISSITEIASTSFTAYAGYRFNGTLELTGLIPASWKTEDKLPKGLTLDPSGIIRGTPSSAGNYTLRFTAKTEKEDIFGNVALIVNPKPKAPKISTSSLPAGTRDTEYSQTLKASGTEPLTFTAKGLPNGLRLNPSTGAVTGTPLEAGKYNVSITVSNITTELAGTSATKQVKLDIKDFPPAISFQKSGRCCYRRRIRCSAIQCISRYRHHHMESIRTPSRNELQFRRRALWNT